MPNQRRNRRGRRTRQISSQPRQEEAATSWISRQLKVVLERAGAMIIDMILVWTLNTIYDHLLREPITKLSELSSKLLQITPWRF